MKKTEQLSKDMGRKRGERSGRSGKRVSEDKKIANRAMRRNRKQHVEDGGVIERKPYRGYEF